MNISAADAIGPAFQQMKRILFSPFDFVKWLVIGLCVFLVQLSEGGFGGFSGPGGNFGGSGSGGSSGGDFSMDSIMEFINEQWIFVVSIIGVVAVIFVLFLALGIVFLWLGSRGHFMFLDNVVHNRGEVVEPWKRHRYLGNSLFFFRLILILVSTLLFVGLLVVLGVMIWPDIRAEQFTQRTLLVVLGGVALFIPIWLALLTIAQVLKDFVVPIMYKRNYTTMAAFGVFWDEIMPGNLGSLIVFYLLKLLLAMVAGVLMFILTCLTCCIAAIPYVNCVVFLPVFVFFRCYSLCFLEQYGEDWRFFAREAPEGPSAPPPEPDAP